MIRGKLNYIFFNSPSILAHKVSYLVSNFLAVSKTFLSKHFFTEVIGALLGECQLKHSIKNYVSFKSIL